MKVFEIHVEDGVLDRFFGCIANAVNEMSETCNDNPIKYYGNDKPAGRSRSRHDEPQEEESSGRGGRGGRGRSSAAKDELTADSKPTVANCKACWAMLADLDDQNGDEVAKVLLEEFKIDTISQLKSKQCDEFFAETWKEIELARKKLAD